MIKFTKGFYSHLVRLSFFVLAGIVAVSCNLNKDFQQPAFERQGMYRNMNSTDTTSAAELHWSKIYTDPALQELISEGVAKNYDLQVANQRLLQARASLLSQKGILLPSLNLSGNAFSGNLADDHFGESYEVLAKAGWELDIWGRLRSGKRAAVAEVLASESYRRAVQTQLVANIANYYYTLLGLDQQLKIAQETAQNRSQFEETLGALKEAAQVTSADVLQSRASRLGAEALVQELGRQIRANENALSVLLARNPGPIVRDSLNRAGIPELLRVGVPALLLSNRPDVAQAEYDFQRAFELVNVARASLYPQITLTGNAGFRSGELADLFDPGSLVANIAAGLVQPVFNHNANKARLRSSEAAREAAYLNYERVLLQAGAEVSGAVSAYRTAREKINLHGQQVEALQQAVSDNRELLQYNMVNYIDVLTAQQSLLTAELTLVDDYLQLRRALIDLYRALGGGWNNQ